MSLVVVDASVLVAFYSTDEDRHATVADRLRAGDALHAPAHLDVEVLSALRGLARNNPPLDCSMLRAVAHLADFPIRRVPLAPLLERIWELRHVTASDAAYVALAERLDAVLMTSDAHLASASGPRCSFELI